MKKCIIAISSINHALRAEKLLHSHSIQCRITKLQPQVTKKGCAYGLEISCKDVPSAITFLNNAGISFSEIVR